MLNVCSSRSELCVRPPNRRRECTSTATTIKTTSALTATIAAIAPTDNPNSGCGGGGVGGMSSVDEADFEKTLPASSCVATDYNCLYPRLQTRRVHFATAYNWVSPHLLLSFTLNTSFVITVRSSNCARGAAESAALIAPDRSPSTTLSSMRTWAATALPIAERRVSAFERCKRADLAVDADDALHDERRGPPAPR